MSAWNGIYDGPLSTPEEDDAEEDRMTDAPEKPLSAQEAVARKLADLDSDPRAADFLWAFAAEILALPQIAGPMVERAAYRAALEPFARAAELFAGGAGVVNSNVYAPAAGPSYALWSSDLRAARQALAQFKGDGDGR